MLKATKILAASVLGVSLVVGGGTYALWTSTVTPPTKATINVGASSLVAQDAGTWTDANRFAADGTTPKTISITDFRAVPGDKLVYSQKFVVKADGDNTKTQVNLQFLNNGTDAKTLRAQGISLDAQLRDSAGKPLASSDTTASNLNASYTFNGATPAAGSVVELYFTFDFKSTVTADSTKLMKTVIDSAIITANQQS